MSREKSLASEEEKKVQVINADVAKKQKACQEDLAKAEPALIAAKNALGTLNKVNEDVQLVRDGFSQSDSVMHSYIHIMYSKTIITWDHET